MRAFDVFEDDLRSWFAADGEAPIGPEIRDRAIAAAVGHRPRPSALATIGSHWIGDAAWNGRAARQVRAPGLRFVAVVLVLAVLALIGTVLIVAAPSLFPSPADGRLLYDHDGDIIIAGADGSGTRVVVDGAPASDASGAHLTLVPEVWSPDGRHFIYHEDRPAGVITYIADKTGRTEATFLIRPLADLQHPRRNVDATNLRTWWSPDSTMLAVFPWTATEVSIYGLDGALVTTTPLPSGYTMFRQFGLGGWMPDGRSVLAIITSRSVNLQPEVWRLPLDGQGPTQVPDGDAYVDPGWSLSPDGRHVAFHGHVNLDGRAQYAASPGEGADTIYVADADGSNQRPVAGTTSFGGVGPPQWSPDGTQILYVVAEHGYRYNLHIVDVVSGNDHLLAKVLSDGLARHGWTPEGDAVLIGGYVVAPALARQPPSQLGDENTFRDRGALVALWSVNADGSGLELIAEGINYFAVTP